MPLEIALEAEIGHDRRDDAGLGQAAVLLPGAGHHAHELVAVDLVALLVDDQHPVRIAVEGDAHIGAQLAHLVDQGVRRRGADLVVDVEAVRLDADRHHLGAELPQGLRGDLVAGAVGAIDHHAHAFEVDLARQGPLGELDVTGLDALDALGAAEGGGFGQAPGQIGIDQGLDLQLHVVAELEPVGAEQLDAVVLVGVVRGGDHDAEVAAHGAGQHGDGGRRDRAEEQHVHADRGEARLEGGFDHVAGEPRILADHDPVAVIAPLLEHEAGGLPDLEGEIRRDDAVRAAANAVCSEVFTHVLCLRIPSRCGASWPFQSNLPEFGQGSEPIRAITSDKRLLHARNPALKNISTSR